MNGYVEHVDDDRAFRLARKSTITQFTARNGVDSELDFDAGAAGELAKCLRWHCFWKDCYVSARREGGRDPNMMDEDDSDDDRFNTAKEGGPNTAALEEVCELLEALSAKEEWLARGFWTEEVVREMMPLLFS